MEIRRITNASIILLVMVLLVVGIVKGVILSNRYIAFGIPAALLGMILIGKMEFLWCMLVGIFGSKISVGSAELFSLLAFGFSLGGLLVVAMHRSDGTPMKVHHRYLLGLLFISFTLPMFRGLGIKALGSSMWGGIQYFTLWGGIGFCLISSKMRISERNLIRAIFAMLIIGAMPGILRTINEFSGGRLDELGRFISGVSVNVVADPESTTGTRLEGIHFSGIHLILLSMALIAWKKVTTFKVLSIFFVGVGILGLAGYRSALMLAVLMVGFYYLQMKKVIPIEIKRGAISVGVITLVLLPFLLPHLPFAFQRMFAWIPGVKISQEVLLSAEGTSEWRIEMWRQMLPMIKDYWLIGRGLAFNLGEAYLAYISHSDMGSKHQFFIQVHNYHSGPLYLLIDYGIPGFICATGFMLTALRFHWRAAKLEWADCRLQNLHAVLLAQLSATVLMFFGVYGALHNLMIMLLDVVLLMMLYKINESRQGDKQINNASGNGAARAIVNGRKFAGQNEYKDGFNR